MATESKLWQQINALGGVPSNDYDRGFNDAIRQVLELIEADEAASSQAEIERLREALREIIREDDTGPMRYEISDRTYPPAQALGGSEGKFAAIARTALSDAA